MNEALIQPFAEAAIKLCIVGDNEIGGFEEGSDGVEVGPLTGNDLGRDPCQFVISGVISIEGSRSMLKAPMTGPIRPSAS